MPIKRVHLLRNRVLLLVQLHCPVDYEMSCLFGWKVKHAQGLQNELGFASFKKQKLVTVLLN